MPTPKKTADGNHVYSSLTDVIANMLASATPVDNFEEQCCKYSKKYNSTNPEDFEVGLSTTPCAHELYLELKGDDIDNDVMYLWIKEWSDGFDPSHTKSNRSQVWMKTYTICPPHNGTNKEQNTFTMSFANQTDEHESLDKELFNELKFLRDGKYFLSWYTKKTNQSKSWNT